MAEHVPANIPPVDEQRRPGMDQTHHAFRTLTEAPRFTWPDGARTALTVTLVLDYWELDPPKDASRDPRIVSPLGSFFPDWLTWSQREYGARVGIFRVLEVLDRFGLTPSVALGAAAAIDNPIAGALRAWIQAKHPTIARHQPNCRRGRRPGAGARLESAPGLAGISGHECISPTHLLKASIP